MDAEGTGERPGLVGCYPPLHPGQPSTAPQRIVTSCPISAALLGQALFLATWRNSPGAWRLLCMIGHTHLALNVMYVKTIPSHPSRF